MAVPPSIPATTWNGDSLFNALNQWRNFVKILSCAVFPIVSDKSRVVAFATAKMEFEAGSCLILRELTLVDGERGLFLSFPQHKFSAKRDHAESWVDVYALTGSHKMALEKALIEAYHRKANLEKVLQ
jgi:DNA-binding cell septation regulator SpoVG